MAVGVLMGRGWMGRRGRTASKLQYEVSSCFDGFECVSFFGKDFSNSASMHSEWLLMEVLHGGLKNTTLDTDINDPHNLIRPLISSMHVLP